MSMASRVKLRSLNFIDRSGSREKAEMFLQQGFYGHIWFTGRITPVAVGKINRRRTGGWDMRSDRESRGERTRPQLRQEHWNKRRPGLESHVWGRMNRI